jgi:hypothetical protein
MVLPLHDDKATARRGLAVELGKVEVGAGSQGTGQVEARLHGGDWMVQQVRPLLEGQCEEKQREEDHMDARADVTF